MDQGKIGKFIAERRRGAGLTQAQLAERLGITDRAVSKWECGRAMPDSSIMLSLCEILDIGVGDLLRGEITDMENINRENEKIILELIKEKEACDRQLLKVEWVIGIFSVLIFTVPVLLGGLLPMDDWMRPLIMLSGFIPAFIGIYFALRIEQTAGYYKCKHCGHCHVPSYNTVLFAMHFGRTRYMKCPRCGKKSWQRKVISKE